MEREILTVEQAADYLQVRRETILRKINSGEIKASKIGRIWRIQRNDLIEYLENTKMSETN